MIVRFIEYIIGRLDGQYLPGDPSLYRSKNSNVLSHEGNGARFDPRTVLRTSKENSAMGTKVTKMNSEGVADFVRFQSPTEHSKRQKVESKHKDSLFNIIEEDRNVIVKVAKIKKILSKHGSPANVQHMLHQVSDYCITTGNYAPLDIALEEITKWDEFQESRFYLSRS